jgi:hypothetical protein
MTLGLGPSTKPALLAYDPDKKSFDVEEAQAALEAEQANLIPSPIRRAHPDVPGQGGGDFIDGENVVWDHKRAIYGAKQIARTAEKENVIVDCTGMNSQEKEILFNEIMDNISTNITPKKIILVPLDQ